MIGEPLSSMPMMIWMMLHWPGHYLHWTFVVPICVNHHSVMKMSMTTIAFGLHWMVPCPLVAAHAKNEKWNKEKQKRKKGNKMKFSKIAVECESEPSKERPHMQS